MKELAIRTTTAIFFVLIIVSGISFNPWTFFTLFLIIIIGTLNEYYTIIRLARSIPQKTMGIVTGILLFAVSFFNAIGIVDGKFFAIVIPFIFLIFIFEIFANNRYPINNIAYTILGIIYIALPFSLANYLILKSGNVHLVTANSNTNNIIDQFGVITNFSYNKINFHPNILLGIFFLTWINDTGAYLTGVTIGKNRLFPRVSPKKSWEGSIGGLIFTIIGAYIISRYFIELSPTNWFVVAFITVIFATLGDLTESWFKRSLKIKDSGRILPGHGGLLDRFDAIIMVIPFVFTYFKLFL